MRATFSYNSYVIFGKGHPHKMVAMVTRKRLSLIFFFQSVDYRFIGKVTKFQEKNFVRSSVILEKPRGGGGGMSPVGIGLKPVPKTTLPK